MIYCVTNGNHLTSSDNPCKQLSMFLLSEASHVHNKNERTALQ